MFIQIKDGRIVRISEVSNGDDIEMELPENFDYDHIDRYEVVDGSIIENDLPQVDSEPTQEERIAALEEENAMLMECILEMSEIVYA